jgi:hypothetical protein
VRGGGLDAEYQRVGARSGDSAFSGGLYLAGKADIDKASVEVATC